MGEGELELARLSYASFQMDDGMKSLCGAIKGGKYPRQRSVSILPGLFTPAPLDSISLYCWYPRVRGR